MVQRGTMLTGVWRQRVPGGQQQQDKAITGAQGGRHALKKLLSG
jgi:hypothetical protein